MHVTDSKDYLLHLGTDATQRLLRNGLVPGSDSFAVLHTALVEAQKVVYWGREEKL